MAGPVKNVYKRGEGRFTLYRKSWSYRRRRHHRRLILSDTRDQGLDATCLYNAICGVMEAELCMQGIIVKLSVDHLAMMASDWISCASGPQQRCLSTELPTILNNLACVGIYTDDDYKMGCVTGTRYKIRSYEQLSWFKSTTPGAVHKLRERGPLLAVIQISSNFVSDFLSGRVYWFDKAKCSKGRQIPTHAVISTGYAIDNLLPIWEMQNSHGEVG
uniref:Peptidase C1A papain C-terminal domain-containing protein n=2 Tax=Triticum urartu TaxID=4572 RepID=A0A8R7JVY9_TRIUA